MYINREEDAKTWSSSMCIARDFVWEFFCFDEYSCVGIQKRLIERLFFCCLGSWNEKGFACMYEKHKKAKHASVRTLCPMCQVTRFTASPLRNFLKVSHFSNFFPLLFGCPPEQNRKKADDSFVSPISPHFFVNGRFLSSSLFK